MAAHARNSAMKIVKLSQQLHGVILYCTRYTVVFANVPNFIYCDVTRLYFGIQPRQAILHEVCTIA